MIEGKKIKARTDFQKEMKQRFTDIQIARAMKCPIQYIWALPGSVYADICLILNKESAKRKNKKSDNS